MGDTSIFYIGKANWSEQGEFCNALIDNVRIYNFALNEGQAEKEYAGYDVSVRTEYGLANAVADQEAANAVIQLIEAIGTVSNTAESKGKIEAAREGYDQLTEEQKDLIDEATYGILTEAEAAYETLVAEEAARQEEEQKRQEEEKKQQEEEEQKQQEEKSEQESAEQIKKEQAQAGTIALDEL